MSIFLTLSNQDQGKKVADINDTASLPMNGTDASEDRVSWKEKIERDLEKERKAKQDEKQNRGNSLICCISSSWSWRCIWNTSSLVACSLLTSRYSWMHAVRKWWNIPVNQNILSCMMRVYTRFIDPYLANVSTCGNRYRVNCMIYNFVREKVSCMMSDATKKCLVMETCKQKAPWLEELIYI